MRPRPIFIVIAVWTLLGILFSVQVRMESYYLGGGGRMIGGGEALILSLAGWYGWALLSPLVVWIARRFGTSWKKMLLHIPIGFALTTIKIVATSAILRRAGYPPQSTFSVLNLPLNLLTYAAIVGVVHAVSAYRRAAEARALLIEARLDVLKAQLEPHFLFNTLHSIAELMHHDIEAADRMLTRLSELLRASLDAGGRQEVRLAEELALVERYLEIERVRLGSRLRIAMDIDPKTLDSLVPVFVLQPIVENAVRYAVAARSAGGTIKLRTEANKGALQIDVEDDGPGFVENGTKGIGLVNTRARLEHLYGSPRVTIDRGAMGGARVRLMLPFRHEPRARADRR
jgi:two-component system, LytTR family, sensor kinase